MIAVDYVLSGRYLILRYHEPVPAGQIAALRANGFRESETFDGWIRRDSKHARSSADWITKL